MAVEAEKRQDGSISSEVCQSPWAWLHRPQSEALHGKIIMMMNEKALAKSEQGLLASSRAGQTLYTVTTRNLAHSVSDATSLTVQSA